MSVTFVSKTLVSETLDSETLVSETLVCETLVWDVVQLRGVICHLPAGEGRGHPHILISPGHHPGITLASP